ncbi:MAG: sulfite exporter TauE/SafE family protein [Alphaproteobacteria bacterium]|nr:sulfite exporter TauE/SafE family protein [Alphaproteobacteria bacterium]MBP7757807.1 sulfite exporter TauE/SafE family protein [Alphaproteobacteria bacterium]MBP7760993.1 sulfite exporter TauE/SafE family protein [Alphaproteobacteria bacterium]MBP7905915.1 sulfite exporter TauE/SafE family protein [Alphaproteobacteria bacterium]
MLEIIPFILIGFIAQFVDSAIGMAFGTLTSTLLLLTGIPPQTLSATVHTAEIFGGSASAFSHWRMGNIDRELLKKLAVPALIGAVIGTLLLTLFSNEGLKPWLGLYFTIIGLVILTKALKPDWIAPVHIHRRVLGFFGGFLDAFGGAGWGEFVSSGLVLRGFEIRNAVGSMVTVEFMVSVVVTVVFVGTVGITNWPVIFAVAAAPLGAWACKVAPAKPLKIIVGLTISIIGLKTFAAGLGIFTH